MKKLRLIGLSLVMAVISVNASAVTIEYTLDSNGGNLYQYNYTVINDDFAAGVELFDIYFDYNLYEALNITSNPADWDSFLNQPAPGVPDDGALDSFAFVAPLALGDSVSGFSVSFLWLGSPQALPGAQFFEIFNPDTFGVVHDGTTALQTLTPVPLPGALVLFATGLVGLWSSKKKLIASQA